MAYSDVALLANDVDFIARVTAAAATEIIIEPAPTWTQNNIWEMAASPGFGDAYASAILNNVERPGNDPSVISDAMILSAVQTLVGSETPEESPAAEEYGLPPAV